MHLDDLVGNDSNAVAPAQDDLFEVRLLAQARRHKAEPAKLQSFIAGLAHQGLLTRPGIASALAPFMALPKPEGRTHKRARMAKLINECVTAKECVTREDLLSAGFTEADLTDLYRDALRVSGVERMAA